MVRLAVVLTAAIATMVLIALAGMWVPSAVMSRAALVSAAEDQLKSSVSLLGPRIVSIMQDASKMGNIMETYWNIVIARNQTEPIDYLYETFGEALWGISFHNTQFAAVSFIVQLSQETIQTTSRRECLPLQSTDAMWVGAQVTSRHWGESDLVKGSRNWMNPLEALVSLGDSYDCGTDPTENQVFSNAPSWDKGFFAVGISNTTVRLMQRPLIIPGKPNLKAKATIAVTVTVGDYHPPGYDSFTTANDLLVEAAANSKLEETFILVDDSGRLLATSSSNQKTDLYSSNGVLAGLTMINNASQVLSPSLEVGNHFVDTWCNNGVCELEAVPSLFETQGFTVSSRFLVDDLAVNLNLLLLCVVQTSDVVHEANRMNIQLAIVGCIVIVVTILSAIALGMRAASPIINFSNCIHLAADLQSLEEIRDRKTNGFVAELTDMNESLIKLVLKLIEYRTYLPASMVATINSDAQPEQAFSMSFSDSNNSKGSADAGMNRSGSRAQLTSIKDPRMSVSTQCSMISRNASVMITSVDAFHAAMNTERPEKVVLEFATYITIFTDSVQGTKGTLDRFNGDRVYISWNTSQVPVSGHSVAAMRTACQVRDRFVKHTSTIFKGVMGIGVTTGKITSGNAGNKLIRGFTVCGLTVHICLGLAKLTAQRCGTSIMCDTGCHRESAVHFDTLPYGIVSSEYFKSTTHMVFEPAMSANLEWMYELSNAFGVEGLLQAIDQSDWEAVQEKYLTAYVNCMKQKLPFAQGRIDAINAKAKEGNWVSELFNADVS